MGAPLRDGSWVTLDKVRMRVVEIRGKDLVLYVPDPAGAGTTWCLKLNEARPLLEHGKIDPGEERSILGWSEVATEEMIRRRVYCRACDELLVLHKGERGWARRPDEGYAKVAELTAKKLHQAKAKEAGKPRCEIAFVPAPSGSTLRKWYSDWIKAERADEALVPRHDKKGGPSTMRLTSKVRKAVEDAVRDHYLVQERPPVSLVFEYVLEALTAARQRAGADAEAQAGLQPPHLETLRRFIGRRVTEYEATLRRQGSKAAGALSRRGRPPETVPLAVAETDSTPLDLFVVLRPGDHGYDNARSTKQVARPYLTVVLDVATRMVLGFHIGLEPPSWAAVMSSLIHAIRPKDVAGCAPGAIWPVEGAPSNLRFDGGGENKFLDEQASRSVLDMTLVKCPAGQPRTKAHVERFLGTANRSFTANLPGRTFSSPKERGEYDAEAQAVLTVDQVRERFLIWVVDGYHNKGHRGSDMFRRTPLKVWQEHEEQLRAPPNVSDDELVACLSVVVGSSITPAGVEFEGLRYTSPKLLRLGQEKRAVKIRLDPRDLKQVLVLSAGSRVWIQVPKSAANPLVADTMNLAQWRAHRVRMRRKGAPTDQQEAARSSAPGRIAQGTKHTRVSGSKHIDNRFSKIDEDVTRRAV